MLFASHDTAAAVKNSRSRVPKKALHVVAGECSVCAPADDKRNCCRLIHALAGRRPPTFALCPKSLQQQPERRKSTLQCARDTSGRSKDVYAALWTLVLVTHAPFHGLLVILTPSPLCPGSVEESCNQLHRNKSPQ